MNVRIVVFSTSPVARMRWCQGLLEFSPAESHAVNASPIQRTRFEVSEVTRHADLLATVHALQPALVLIDLTGCPCPPIQTVRVMREHQPECRIVLLSDVLSDDAELELIRAGVYAFCQRTISPWSLGRVAQAVVQGEYCFRRSLMPRLLAELQASPTHSLANDANLLEYLAALTARERDIVAGVLTGKQNKEIARGLAITERTVKAHLTKVFRKFGVGSRVELVLALGSGLVRDRGQAAPVTH